MNEATTPSDYSVLEPLVEQLTQQRDHIATFHRHAAAGEQVKREDLLKELRVTQDAIASVKQKITPDDTKTEYSVRDLLTGYWDQVTKRCATATTGFRSLNDALSGGFEAGRLVVVLGAPNAGKTTFTHQMADHIADSGRPVLYITSEDSPSTLFAKTLARVGQVGYTAVLKGWETEASKIDAAIAAQMDRKSTDRLRYLDASNGIDMETIKERAQAHFSCYGVENGGGSGVLVIDYLQRIARVMKTRMGISQDLREVVTLLTEQLRALAIELDCTVIAIASQHRASGYSVANNSLSSAKESGDIEYGTDVLMALGEDKDRKKTVPHLTPILLRIDKNRQGQKDQVIQFDFYADRQQFTERKSGEQ